MHVSTCDIMWPFKHMCIHEKHRTLQQQMMLKTSPYLMMSKKQDVCYSFTTVFKPSCNEASSKLGNMTCHRGKFHKQLALRRVRRAAMKDGLVGRQALGNAWGMVVTADQGYGRYHAWRWSLVNSWSVMANHLICWWWLLIHRVLMVRSLTTDYSSAWCLWWVFESRFLPSVIDEWNLWVGRCVCSILINDKQSTQNHVIIDDALWTWFRKVVDGYWWL